MRVLCKGGLWRNCEDEVLKSGVIKYGTQNWDRVSSLLNRKTAKQCKARWYEWLDPSIKKIEWTRQEDEKLLHLAKLIPTQWRTIAPIVGRTPSQCLDRYEKLLDATAGDDAGDPDNDPRKLRPGEMEPNPETKPARPDGVDLDEDELEMLSQARARLANTRGKKAKRKAREKQIQQARMLASLQKSRECRAAGISTRKRKRRGVDYNAEIPFQKRPPPGYFDVVEDDEHQESFKPKFPITIEQIEGRKRVDAEQELRKLDVAKSKISQRRDTASAILQVTHHPEEKMMMRKRMKLMLPTPQISDQELEEIAKMGYASDILAESEEGSFATQTLVANYASRQGQGRGRTPLPTPQRTPASKSNAITIEAERLAQLRDAQTPLLGGENTELYPNKREIHTSKPMPTPSTTPIRDELCINKMHEKKLSSNFSNLPYPKNEYQIVIQPLPQYNEELEEETEQDASDPAREIAEEEVKQEALLRQSSEVLQRDPPTPNAYEFASVASSGKGLTDLQNDFKDVKKTLDHGTKKAQGLEQKIKLLTEGYQIQAGNLWSQIEKALKEMNTAANDLECFQVLQKQEQVGATNRINCLWEEAKKQEELQQTLQSRYGSLVAEQEKFSSLVNGCRVQA